MAYKSNIIFQLTYVEADRDENRALKFIQPSIVDNFTYHPRLYLLPLWLVIINVKNMVFLYYILAFIPLQLFVNSF